MPVHTHGTTTTSNTEQFDAQLHAGLTHADIELIEAPRPCNDDDCIRSLAHELDVDYAVVVEVTVAARDFHLEFRSFRATDMDTPSVAEIDCPICGTAEVADHIAARSRLIRDWVLADSERARIHVAGEPLGAVVSVDGEPVGGLPFHGDVDPGVHVVTVSAPGHVAVQRRLEAFAGSSIDVEISLADVVETPHPAVPYPHDPPPRALEIPRWRAPLGGVATGVGLVALVTGAAFIALDGRPIGARCSDPTNIDADGDCKHIYTSETAGVGLLVGGITLAAVGVGTLIVDLRQRQGQRQSPRLGVVAGLNRVVLQLDF